MLLSTHCQPGSIAADFCPTLLDTLSASEDRTVAQFKTVSHLNSSRFNVEINQQKKSVCCMNSTQLSFKTWNTVFRLFQIVPHWTLSSQNQGVSGLAFSSLVVCDLTVHQDNFYLTEPKQSLKILCLKCKWWIALHCKNSFCHRSPFNLMEKCLEHK